MQDMMLLVEPVIPRLRRYARSLLRDSTAADDLVQDCLERAISRWHQRRPDRDVRSWLFAILHNLAVNRLRQAQRRGMHISVQDAEPAAMARVADQESSIHYSDTMEALYRLPDDQRAVVLLVTIEDLSYAEAAMVLGVPLGTVMSRLSRARTRLRDDLGGSRHREGPQLRRIK